MVSGEYRVGWDLDGVICEDPPWWLPRLAPFVAWHQRTARHRFTPPFGFVITGRLVDDLPRTAEWMARHGVTLPLLLNPDTPAEATNHKINTVISLGLRAYVESDPAVARRMAAVLADYNVTVYLWEEQ